MALTLSRYDMYSASVTADPVDRQAYPDSLSTDFSSFRYYEPPYITSPDQRMQEKPYIYTYKLYNVPYYEDIVLNINGNLHISLLFESTEIKFPTTGDLNIFMKKVVS